MSYHSIKTSIKVGRYAFITALGALLMPQQAFSQDITTGEVADEIIVTGTSSEGRTALETSYGVAIMSEEDIAKKAALGTADLLDSIPGLFGEGYSGEANNSISARGIRENFNTYISLQEDGLPVVYTPFFSEFEIRSDASYGRIETILGGPSGVFTAQGASATVNFISRIPTEKEADIAVAVTDYGSIRTDFFIGGPIDDKWTATIGGFYRVGDGVRRVGFTGDKGGQVRANIVRKLGDSNQGKATFSLKLIDDNTLFYTPQPVDFSNGTPKAIPGFDPRHDALNGPDTLVLNNKTVDGVVPLNLIDGEGSNTLQFSFKYEWDFDNGFRFKNHARISDIRHNANDLRGGDSSTIFRATDFIADNTKKLLDAFSTATSVRLRQVNNNSVISDPAGLNGNGLLTKQNVVHYVKNQSNFINDMQVSYSNDKLDATLGFQYWDLNSDTDYIQGDFLTDIRDQANRIDLEAVDADGNVVGHLTDSGVLTHSSINNSGTWDVNSRNIYANIEYLLTNKLRVDAGYRYENVDFDVSGEDVDFNVPLTGALNDPLVLADDVVAISPNGNILRGSSNPSDSTWTVGGNYKFTDSLAVYARYAQAHDYGFNGLDFAYFNVPAFGTPAGSNLGVSERATRLKFAEMGVRGKYNTLSFFATGFLTKNLDVSQRVRLPSGALGEIVIDTEAKGVEFFGNWDATNALNFELSGVIQSAKVVDDTGGPQNGLRVNRLPNLQLQGTATYEFSRGSVYVSAVHYGDRPANNENTLKLPSDTAINAGVFFDLSDSVRLSLQGRNLTDEAIPQTGSLDNNAGDNLRPEFLYAGHLPGRRFTGTVKYKF